MKWLTALLSIFDRFGRNAEKADNKRAGANEADLENRKTNEQVRKDANDVWSGKSRSRLRPTNGDDKRRG